MWLWISTMYNPYNHVTATGAYYKILVPCCILFTELEVPSMRDGITAKEREKIQNKPVHKTYQFGTAVQWNNETEHTSLYVSFPALQGHTQEAPLAVTCCEVSSSLTQVIVLKLFQSLQWIDWHRTSQRLWQTLLRLSHLADQPSKWCKGMKYSKYNSEVTE